MVKKYDTSTKIFTLFIFLGIALSVINFLNNRSLWLDEAFLALNIVNKSPLELLQPLDLNQVAPIGFLMVEKTFATLFGNTDWSMRIAPLIVFLLSIPLIYSIVFRLTEERKIGLFSAAWFSLSNLPLYYSSEAKQYMSDVFICLTIILVILNFIENKKRFYPLVLTGVISVWFSNVAVILLFCGGLLLLFNATKKPGHLFLKTISTIALWVVSFGFYYLLFIHEHPSEEHMLAFWGNNGSFLPQNIFTPAFHISLMKKLKSYFVLLGAGERGLITVPFFITGLFYLAKYKKRLIFLFLAPLIVHLVLSYLKLYPFNSRLILYLQPLLIIIITIGVYNILNLFKLKQLQTATLSCILVLSSSLVALRGFPFEREEIKKSVSYLNKNIATTDQLFIFYATVYAFRFYETKAPVYSALEKSNVFLGKAYKKDWSKYEESIKKIHHSPIWLLFSHVHQPRGSGADVSVEVYIIERLKANGFKVVDQQNYTGSSVYKAIPISTEFSQNSTSFTAPSESEPH